MTPSYDPSFADDLRGTILGWGLGRIGVECLCKATRTLPSQTSPGTPP
jgi:hypothetical protein